MSQPQNPGQPYVPPSSAASAPSGYVPQQYQGQYQQPGQAPMGGSAAYQPPQPYNSNAQYAPQGSGSQGSSDSIMGTLFNTARGFIEKYGNLIVILAAVAFTLSWLYGAWSAGDAHANITYDYNNGQASSDFNWARAIVDLLLNSPWWILRILLVRGFVELVRNAVSSRSVEADARS